jgi:hypothetical protein
MHNSRINSEWESVRGSNPPKKEEEQQVSVTVTLKAIFGRCTLKKVNPALQQAVEAHRVMRRRGSYIFF